VVFLGSIRDWAFLTQSRRSAKCHQNSELRQAEETSSLSRGRSRYCIYYLNLLVERAKSLATPSLSQLVLPACFSGQFVSKDYKLDVTVLRFELVGLIAHITLTLFIDGVDCLWYLDLLHIRWELNSKFLGWCGRAHDQLSSPDLY